MISILNDWTSTHLLSLVTTRQSPSSDCKISLCVIQSRQLRKLIQQTFQQYATLKEDDCMVKFFETLKDFVSYDEEVFPCELVVSSNSAALPLHPVIVTVINVGGSEASFAHRHWSALTCQQQGWSLSVELVIGGRGIRQRTQKNSAVSMFKI